MLLKPFLPLAGSALAIGHNCCHFLSKQACSTWTFFKTNMTKNGACSSTIVLSGPSGSGKSTILAMAMERYPGKFAFSVSHTTRNPRPGEIDGVHYHFTDMENMRRMIANSELFEHAEFSGNLYGTSKKAVEVIQNAGKICVLDVELQGVLNFKKSNLPAKYILIKPPRIEELQKRLAGRGTETEESIRKRLDRAKEDLAAIDVIMAQNEDLFDHVIVNDDLDEAYAKFINVLPLGNHQ